MPFCTSDGPSLQGSDQPASKLAGATCQYHGQLVATSLLPLLDKSLRCDCKSQYCLSRRKNNKMKNLSHPGRGKSKCCDKSSCQRYSTLKRNMFLEVWNDPQLNSETFIFLHLHSSYFLFYPAMYKVLFSFHTFIHTSTFTVHTV